MENRIKSSDLQQFAAYLRQEEKSEGTIEKYLRDAAAFAAHMGGAPVTKEAVASWRDGLVTRGYAPTTVNSMVASVNALLCFFGLGGLPGPCPAAPAADVPGSEPGADQGGI